MNDRDTLETQLNVFGEFDPELPEDYRRAKYVFLANGVPAVQMKVLSQVPGRKLAVADTMDLWINTAREDLNELLGQLDGLVLNDSEAKLDHRHRKLWLPPGIRCARWVPNLSSSKRASTGRCSSASTKPTCCRRFPPIA